MISAKQLQQANTSTQLEHLLKRFELWRKSHKPRARIPDRLWDSAVKVAGQCGLHKTARVLHLEYYALKKRLDGINAKNEPSFIELRPPAYESIPECIIELENQNGGKMRIHLKGLGIPDLTALGGMFWRNDR